MAMILLSYVAGRFVQTPGQVLALDLAGIYLPLQVNINTALAILVAGLTAAGADWLIQAEAADERSRFRHWLLPAMTAWVLGLMLANLPFDPEWWLAFGFSALLLLAVILAEFASSSPENRFYAIATQALTFLTFGLFLILAITTRAVALRLYLALPAIALGVLTAASRLQLLRPGQSWQPLSVVAGAFVCIQVAAALHYLPVSPLGYGVALLGLLYALNHYWLGLSSGDEIKQTLREALLPLAVFWLLALLLR
jgi:hypothetical protein